MFTKAQNRVLQAALHELKAEMDGAGSYSQAALAKELGVVQQTAGRLLVDGRFSYGPATALARRLGYSGVDALFEEKGVAHARAS